MGCRGWWGSGRRLNFKLSEQTYKEVIGLGSFLLNLKPLPLFAQYIPVSIGLLPANGEAVYRNQDKYQDPFKIPAGVTP